MILRKSDWGLPGHEDAIIHYSTKNESFLKLAYIHREMKIEHWYCCLALINPDLEHVDPHDPNLDMATKNAVVYEMFINPWYYFREFVRVPQDGADPVPFKIHRGSFALIWTFFNNIDIALLLIRQQGKTVVVASLLVYLIRILKGSRTILLTKDSTLRTETISKMKQIRDALPPYSWNAQNDADNTEIFTYNSRGNRLVTCIAQNSKEAALGAGRGLTTARLFSDETAFTKFIRIMLPAALAAGTTARRIAEEAGIPYGNVFTTTPGKRDEEDGKMVYKMFHDGYYWDENLLDVPTRAELIDLITKASKGDRVLIHAPFTHRQLGLTDIDLYKAMANAGGTREEQERDFGLKWTAGSLSSPLSVEEAEMVSGSVIAPAKHIEVFPNNYTIKWYYERNEMAHRLDKMHIIGLDTSDAVGRDNIAMVITHSETMGVAGTGLVNESNLVVFSNWLSDIMTKYPKTVLVIERKSSAPTIIDSLLITLPARGIEASRRIFNRIIQDRDADDLDLKEFRKSASPRSEAFYETYRKHFGFNTTGTSRKLLYGEVLQTAVRMAGDKIHDRQLADELLSLVVKDGRVDHKASGNDDMVVAWLLACWFMLFGRRLEHYGVSNRMLMRRNAANPNDVEFDERQFEQEQAEQEALTEQIDELCSKIARNRNPFIKTTLDRELRVLLSELKLDTSQAATVGELQELIRNERLQSRYLK
jgi:hypothetical protein